MKKIRDHACRKFAVHATTPMNVNLERRPWQTLMPRLGEVARMSLLEHVLAIKLPGMSIGHSVSSLK